MALTTHEQIRNEAGFQSYFVREPFRNSVDGAANTFYVNSDDNIKFVPNFNSGTTIAGISDIQVFLGLSGVYGVSQLGVSAIDIDQGSVRLSVVPVSGASLTISYASSAIPSYQIEQYRLQAESIINQRLSLCYDLPISPTPSSLKSLAARLSAAMLLIRHYGTGARDTAADGYRLYDILMGTQEGVLSSGTDTEITKIGEVGMICTANYQLVDDNGVVIPRNDGDDVTSANTFVSGGRVRGRIYDITEENWRLKPWQEDVNTNQPGSGL